MPAPLLNPYLDFFRALPPGCRRDHGVPLWPAEAQMPDWLAFKSAIASHFAWAVPTDEAIGAIARHATGVVEIGAGSGYWSWLLRQAGFDVAAYDHVPSPFQWTEVRAGDACAARHHPDKALLLCWPPYGSDMALDALRAHAGDCVVFIGEWMGGCAGPTFFASLMADFDCVETVQIPQWFMRDDRLFVFRRRRLTP